jgi:RimJ/RimL family protein N-acetyltransferase
MLTTRPWAKGYRGPVLNGVTVQLTPLTEDHVTELRRIRAAPEVRARWGELAEEGPEDGVTCFAIIVDGAVRGLVQYGEEDDPDYRHASIDIYVDPAVHGRGICKDAVRTLARHLVDARGHHRIVIDPAADNLPAIRCYEAVGFKPVGVMRCYERDPDGGGWHDGLLMDLLSTELT